MVRRIVFAPLTTAVVLVLVTASVAMGASAERRVVMLDACDGPTFNEAIGGPVCDRSGGVTFEKFIGQLVRFGEAPAWRFAPDSLAVARAGSVEAYNGGGEAHTFTEVAAFGGGCVPELNMILGLTPVPECSDPALFGSTLVLPGDELEVRDLASGTHRFECLIHPWMRATVTVD